MYTNPRRCSCVLSSFEYFCHTTTAVPPDYFDQSKVNASALDPTRTLRVGEERTVLKFTLSRAPIFGQLQEAFCALQWPSFICRNASKRAFPCTASSSRNTGPAEPRMCGLTRFS